MKRTLLLFAFAALMYGQTPLSSPVAGGGGGGASPAGSAATDAQCWASASTLGVCTSIVSNLTGTVTGHASLDAALASANAFTVGPQKITLAPAAATIVDGWEFDDTTPASAGNQQYSPAVRFCGQGWKTDSTAGSQAVCLRQYLVPVQGAAAPSSIFTMDMNVNGGAYATTPLWQFNSIPTAAIPAFSITDADGHVQFGVKSTSNGAASTVAFIDGFSSYTARIGMLQGVSGGVDIDSFEIATSGVPSFSMNKDNGAIGLGPKNYSSGFSSATTVNVKNGNAGGSTLFSVTPGDADTAATATISNAGSTKTVHLLGNGLAATIASGFSTTTPTCTNCTDIGGQVTIAATPGNTGVITFGTAYGAVPHCWAQSRTVFGFNIQSVPTTTNLTLNGWSSTLGTAANFTAADIIDFGCEGG